MSTNIDIAKEFLIEEINIQGRIFVDSDILNILDESELETLHYFSVWIKYSKDGWYNIRNNLENCYGVIIYQSIKDSNFGVIYFGNSINPLNRYL